MMDDFQLAKALFMVKKPPRPLHVVAQIDAFERLKRGEAWIREQLLFEIETSR